MRLLATLLLVAVPGVAAADTMYFGLGMGDGHHLDGDLARHFSTDDEVGGRFVGGYRQGDTAFEASFFGTDLHPSGDGYLDSAWASSTLSLGAGVKQFLPLSPNVDLFARVGIDHIWLEPAPDRDGATRLGGWGFDYGAGVEAGTSSARPEWGVRGWLDVGRQHTRLHGNGESMSATFFSWAFGASVVFTR